MCILMQIFEYVLVSQDNTLFLGNSQIVKCWSPIVSHSVDTELPPCNTSQSKNSSMAMLLEVKWKTMFSVIHLKPVEAPWQRLSVKDELIGKTSSEIQLIKLDIETELTHRNNRLTFARQKRQRDTMWCEGRSKNTARLWCDCPGRKIASS